MSIFKAIKNLFSAKPQSGTYMEFSIEMFEASMDSLYQVPLMIKKDILYYVENQLKDNDPEFVVDELKDNAANQIIFSPLDKEDVLISYYQDNETWVVTIFNKYLENCGYEKEDAFNRIQKVVQFNDIRAMKMYISLLNVISHCSS
ncbi:hypothetical protein, partial [Neobacillus vireti]